VSESERETLRTELKSLYLAFPSYPFLSLGEMWMSIELFMKMQETNRMGTERFIEDLNEELFTEAVTPAALKEVQMFTLSIENLEHDMRIYIRELRLAP
jgi:hypothetical protein